MRVALNSFLLRGSTAAPKKRGSSGKLQCPLPEGLMLQEEK